MLSRFFKEKMDLFDLHTREEARKKDSRNNYLTRVVQCMNHIKRGLLQENKTEHYCNYNNM